MDIQTNTPLANLTTMKLGGMARFFGEIRNIADIERYCKAAIENKLKVFVLGGGSNTIVPDEGFDGIVLHNRLSGFEVLEKTSDYVTIRVGAGENWDETVKKTVDMNLTGIEALSGIPGTVGAAPVQNIGAYGQEVSTVITAVSVYEIATGQTGDLSPEQCEFGYRSSIFRESAWGRYIITSVTMRLATTAPQPPFYSAVEDYFKANNIDPITVHALRDAVLDIRYHKLPDPARLPNAGSFFKNAIIERRVCEELLETYPTMPYYPMTGDMVKVPTGWFIDQLGYKGKLMHGIRVHDKNALVLINESATSYHELAAARDEIIGAVRDTFRVSIEQEPLIMAV